MKIDRNNSRVNRDAFNEARIFLGRLRKEFENDSVVEFRATILESLVLFTHGDLAESTKITNRGNSIFKCFDRNVKVRLVEEHISGLTLVGRFEECQTFIHYMQENENHPELENRLLLRVKEGKQRVYCENLNTAANFLAFNRYEDKRTRQLSFDYIRIAALVQSVR